MKTLNAGREFDCLSQRLLDKKTTFILWGAANIGQKFYHCYCDKLHIVGVTDMDKRKQGSKLGDCVVRDAGDVQYDKHSIIIVTTSAYESVHQHLRAKGYIENKDYIGYFLFVKIFEVYRHNYLVSGRLDISITEKCTLKCIKCNMFMPYFQNPQNCELTNVIQDIDAYFQVVDYVKDINLLGGEPFMCQELNDVIAYLKHKYGERIGRVQIFTNGTLLPDSQLLETLENNQIIVQVSDYTNRVNYVKRLHELKNILEKHHIAYYVLQSEEWGDFGFPDNPNALPEGELIPFFDTCKAPFRGLYDSKVYFCHLETSAIRAGLYDDNDNDYFDLSGSCGDVKKSFLEFDEGYSAKGFVTFCSKCRGCNCVNDLTVVSAVQLKG